jgi:membrane associated rhomboid family serine protease
MFRLLTDHSNDSVKPERALEALYDFGQKRPVITYSFLSICFLVTVPTLFYPPLYEVFGGLEPRRHWWQLFTAAFEHGWPDFHGAVHLALNTFLILECGRPCERLLGRGLFLFISVLSLCANAVTQIVWEGVNGSSLVIWSWGPPLLAALRWARSKGATGNPAYRRLRAILMLMYGIIVLFMAVLPYLTGWRGSPVAALLLGNLYHLVATVVGVIFTAFTIRYIRRRMSVLGRSV